MCADRQLPIVEVFGAPADDKTVEILAALRHAVAVELDRKRRLGQYAVLWQDGQVVRVEAEDLPALP